MPPQPMPPGVAFVLAIIALVIVGTIVMVIYKIASRPMSSSRVRSVPLAPNYDRHFSAVSPAETNTETAETARAAEAIEAEKTAFAETMVAEALARLILAEEVKLTEAVKIGAGKRSGEGYQKWSRLIKAAMERQRETTTPIAERPTSAQFAEPQ